MNKRLFLNILHKCFLVSFAMLISCTTKDPTETNLTLQTFDSSNVAVCNYYFKNQLTNKLLDTCTATLVNDTLMITFGKDNPYWNNCFKIIVFKNKYSGYFLHADDGGAYKPEDYKVSIENLRLHLYKDKFKIGDTVSGWLWATSRLYHFKDITTRDKFEGGFTAVIN